MYMTIYRPTYIKETAHQLTFEDFLKGLGSIDEMQFLPPKKFLKRITFKHEDDAVLQNFYSKHFFGRNTSIPVPTFDWTSEEIEKHYEIFKIPKKSGGLRTICAPDEELKDYLRNVKTYFEYTLKILPHDAAHAYVEGRSTITNNKVHVNNESRWYLKIDLKNFFPSHNKEYIMKMSEQIYPLYYLLKDPAYRTKYEIMLDYALLNGELPQGTPLSPTLTNILMMPIDKEIETYLKRLNDDIVYTRYADDMIISSKFKFDYQKVIADLKRILSNFNTPFEIKPEKTHFGQVAGKNWNLGIMINKDNQMTIGHENNHRFKAMLNNLFRDAEKGIYWSLQDKQELAGKIAYYRAVQPEITNSIIKMYETKHAPLKLKTLLKD